MAKLYRMAQNFDGGRFLGIGVGKSLMSKKLMNAFILSSSQLPCLYCARRFILYSYVVRKS